MAASSLLKVPFCTAAMWPDEVAHALVRAVSRLFSTPWRRTDILPGPGVGMSADAARTSACATLSRPNIYGKCGLGRLPSQYRFARGGHFIHAAGACAVGRCLDQLRVGFNLFGDRDHGFDELVDLVLAFGLGRLDHERPVDNQRKAHGIGMKTVVDQPLGDVPGVHAQLGL